MREFWDACMNMMMGSGGALMMLLMVLFWVAVIVLVVLGIRWLLRQQRGAGTGTGTERAGGGDALRILERRYAAGEIDREEFEERRRALSDT